MIPYEEANKLFAEAFEFSEDDLMANRKEILAESQKTSLRKNYFRSTTFRDGLIGFVIFIFGLWLIMAIDNLNIFVKILILLFGFLIVFIAILRYINIERDIADGKIIVKQCSINLLKQQTSRSGTSYYIGLAVAAHRGEVSDSYDITAKQYKLLHQKVNYRSKLYLTPRSNIIVAIENY